MIAKIRGRQLLVIGTVMIFFLGTLSVQAGTIQIAKGQKVKLRFPAEMKISSKDLSAGVPVTCSLEEAIDVGGITVVEAGALATASVVEVQPAQKPGKPGYIKLQFTSLDAKGSYKILGGDNIKLTGNVEAKGKGKKLLSYIFIFGLFIKGTDAVIPTDQAYPAEVAESVVLESE